MQASKVTHSKVTCIARHLQKGLTAKMAFMRAAVSCGKFKAAAIQPTSPLIWTRTLNPTSKSNYRSLSSSADDDNKNKGFLAKFLGPDSATAAPGAKINRW